jgi:hypothetical protein
MTDAQIIANTRSAENLARTQTGLPPVSQLASRDFTYSQRIAYNKALAAIIAKYPERFSRAQVNTAAVVQAKVYPPLEQPDNPVAVFADEFASQAAKINETLNPFSESNRRGSASTLKWIFIIGVLGAAAWYFGPALTAGGKSLRARFKS